MNEKLLADYINSELDAAFTTDKDIRNITCAGHLIIVDVTWNYTHEAFNISLLDIIAWVWSQTKQGDK